MIPRLDNFCADPAAFFCIAVRKVLLRVTRFLVSDSPPLPLIELISRNELAGNSPVAIRRLSCSGFGIIALGVVKDTCHGIHHDRSSFQDLTDGC